MSDYFYSLESSLHFSWLGAYLPQSLFDDLANEENQ